MTTITAFLGRLARIILTFEHWLRRGRVSKIFLAAFSEHLCVYYGEDGFSSRNK